MVKTIDQNEFTGRSRLVSNVLFTWASQMVFFVAGFIMPRMIDHKLGQEVLGVWDFSWSLVSYFRFIDFGLTSSINWYVARHWGKQEIAQINRVVSSATLALTVAALGILLATAGVVFLLPHWLGPQLQQHVRETQKCVLWLGAMLAFGAATGPFNAVLTGCHQWKLQSIRITVWQCITVTGMFVALSLGAGLATLAAITAIGQSLGSVTIVALAYRVCPGLRLQRSLINWQTIRELYIYSGKTLLPTFSEMLLNQTASILILGSLGPAALAIFSRPRSLTRQLDSLVRKMAMILTPTTSSLNACGHVDEIKSLLVKLVRYSLYLALPLVLLLTIFGGQIIHLWMGGSYANATLTAVLALGFLAACIQTPIFYMLEGLNAHGRAGVWQFLASALSALAVFFALRQLNSGLVGAAMAVTLPLLIVNFFCLPWLLCRRVGLKLRTFYFEVALLPLVHLLPFAVALAAGRLLMERHLILAVVVCALGSATLAVIYWRSVLPRTLKNGLTAYFGKARRLATLSRPAECR
jgi:O-antigen/teichoic acid export membrane protein